MKMKIVSSILILGLLISVSLAAREVPLPEVPGAPPPPDPEDPLPDYSQHQWSTCLTSGDPHFKSLDGSRFDFQGIGHFTMVENSRVHIQAEFAACGSSNRVSCFKAAVIVIGLNKATIEYHRGEKTVRLDGVETNVADITNIRFTLADKKTFVMYQSGAIVVGGYDSDSPQITMRGSSLTIVLPKTNQYLEKVSGICGQFDGDPTNDFVSFSAEEPLEITTKSRKYRNGFINTFAESYSVCATKTAGTTECNAASYFYDPVTETQPTVKMTPESYEFTDAQLEADAKEYCNANLGDNPMGYDNCMLDIALMGKIEDGKDDVESERLAKIWESIGLGLGIAAGIAIVGAVFIFAGSTVYYSHYPEKLPFMKKKAKIGKELDDYGVLPEDQPTDIERPTVITPQAI